MVVIKKTKIRVFIVLKYGIYIAIFKKLKNKNLNKLIIT